MTETRTALRKITFNDGLPMGERGTFTHEGQRWIALPAARYQTICAVMDRLLGLHSWTADFMVTWVNSWPDDATRVAKVMEVTRQARELFRSASIDKAEAMTGRPGSAATTSSPES